jgi:hypothetical protein
MVFACIPKRQNTGYIEIYREDIQFKCVRKNSYSFHTNNHVSSN